MERKAFISVVISLLPHDLRKIRVCFNVLSQLADADTQKSRTLSPPSQQKENNVIPPDDDRCKVEHPSVLLISGVKTIVAAR